MAMDFNDILPGVGAWPPHDNGHHLIDGLPVESPDSAIIEMVRLEFCLRAHRLKYPGKKRFGTTSGKTENPDSPIPKGGRGGDNGILWVSQSNSLLLQRTFLSPFHSGETLAHPSEKTPGRVADKRATTGE